MQRNDDFNPSGEIILAEQGGKKNFPQHYLSLVRHIECVPGLKFSQSSGSDWTTSVANATFGTVCH